ncbi:MAG: hypothetical protein NT165_02155, partial [Candidatus Falkowbacteria bacterium]|nr:hypothetical protein [Candidatus Falkowbacteria bacterium]
KVSRYAFSLLGAEITKLKDELEVLKKLAMNHPDDHEKEIFNLTRKIDLQTKLQNSSEVVDVVEGGKTVQIGYTVNLKIGTKNVQKILDGYAYSNKVCTIGSPIGKAIFDQKKGYQNGHFEIVDFFLEKVEGAITNG